MPITDGNGNNGFPGFDPTASQSLGYIATMLEAGVPVVYAYIADAHDNHTTFSGSFGPGETGYVQQLASYNAAFGKFFARLAAEGITRDNTLFIVTSDENDHFAGQAGSPAGCDGIHTPCTYVRLPAGCDGDSVPCTTTNLGQVDVDMRSLLLTEAPTFAVPSFSVHSDDAPTVYIKGNPGPVDAVTRALEHNMASLVAFDSVVGANVPLMLAMGDGAEMSLLHMVTKDPARTPTFAYFANDDFFITAGSKSVACTSIMACSDEQPGFNWSHGDFQQDITRTWLGMVGPGVRRLGRTGELFTDHTDIRPTLVSLSGLKDDYSHDGRVVFEILDHEALPISLRGHDETLSALAAAYKAINAPLGELGRKSLKIATAALTSDATTIDALDGPINDLTARRNAIAGDMIAMLEAAAFDNKSVDQDAAMALIERAHELLESVR
jgi:arylsulfatase A-like enzyme